MIRASVAPEAEPLFPIGQQDSERELLGKVAQGDKRAFEQLYVAYSHRLSRFLFRLLRRPELVEEVASDVMFVVWQKAATFEGRSSVSTWIFGIAYRTGVKALEKQRKHREACTEEYDNTVDIDPSWQSNPEEALSSELFTDKLRDAINKLSVEHRSVVELTALGHSYSEIAQIVQCPANTVKTRMFHARKRLKHIMSKTEFKVSSEN